MANISKVLYITANPRKVENSYSLTVGEEFLNEYVKENPDDEITSIDLYDLQLPDLDGKIIDFNEGKIEEEQLSDECKLKMKIMNETVEQFMKNDKYIFVSPLWNLSCPPVIRTYFDNVTVLGKTFRYTQTGPVGLLENKKAIHIQASGGIYSEGEMAKLENGNKYIKDILHFMGVSNVDQILIEGTNIQTIDKEELKLKSIEKAKQVAKEF